MNTRDRAKDALARACVGNVELILTALEGAGFKVIDISAGAYCVFCETPIPLMPGFLLAQIVRSHIQECPKHPLAAAHAVIDNIHNDLRCPQWTLDIISRYAYPEEQS